MTKMRRGSMIRDIHHCSRCGSTHKNMVFVKLDRACKEYTHWAECPETEQPILMRIVNRL